MNLTNPVVKNYTPNLARIFILLLTFKVVLLDSTPNFDPFVLFQLILIVFLLGYRFKSSQPLFFIPDTFLFSLYYLFLISVATKIYETAFFFSFLLVFLFSFCFFFKRREIFAKILTDASGMAISFLFTTLFLTVISSVTLEMGLDVIAKRLILKLILCLGGLVISFAAFYPVWNREND